ncbi:MAG: glycosyltransferase family 39 protein [Planctomycetes bacterium]|nr:glycosyltransferase family 39 protein [Planctomycetota bacterium]
MSAEGSARPPLLYTAGALLLAAVAVGLLASTLSNVPYEPKSDDGYYLAFARTIAQEGPGAFPKLFASWNGDSGNWIYPSPLRIGFVGVSALWVKLFGATLPALSWLSIVSHAAWILITACFARRHLEQRRALLATALASFAPLLLGTARQALQDSFLLVWMALACWTFLETLAQPRSRAWRIAFVASFAFAILTKELALLLLPAFVLGWFVERRARAGELPAAPFVWQLAMPGLITAPLFLLAAGGFGPLLQTVRTVLGSPSTNTYAIRFGSGPWYRYLIDYICLSPGVTLLALGFAGALLVRTLRERPARAEVQLGIVAAVLLFEMGFFTKNARYLLILELPLCVFASGMLCELVPAKWNSRWIWIAAAGALLCILDWRTFDYGWVQHGIYDPLSGALLQMRAILPASGR